MLPKSSACIVEQLADLLDFWPTSHHHACMSLGAKDRHALRDPSLSSRGPQEKSEIDWLECRRHSSTQGSGLALAMAFVRESWAERGVMRGAGLAPGLEVV